MQYGENGNCLQAAIASILELPLDKVPDFCLHRNWWTRLEKFLYLHNLEPLRLGTDEAGNWPVLKSYHLWFVRNKDGLRHAVVGRLGEIVHDPHLGNVVDKIEECIVFISLMCSENG